MNMSQDIIVTLETVVDFYGRFEDVKRGAGFYMDWQCIPVYRPSICQIVFPKFSSSIWHHGQQRVGASQFSSGDMIVKHIVVDWCPNVIQALINDFYHSFLHTDIDWIYFGIGIKFGTWCSVICINTARRALFCCTTILSINDLLQPSIMKLA